jgi:hypothetical protein
VNGRLRPPTDIDLRALDVALRVTVTADPDLACSVVELCAAMATTGAAAEPSRAVAVHVTRQGGGRHLVSSAASGRCVVPSDGVLSHVMAAVNGSVLRATPLLVFHCAVITRDGRTVAVVGASGQGKSTPTAAMLQRGWGYVSDEALAMAWDEGPPLAYPRPLSLSPWSRGALGLPAGAPGLNEDFYSAAMLGADVVHRPAPLTHLVALDGSRPRSRPKVTAVHRADALEALLHRGFTMHIDPAPAIRRMQAVVSSAGALRLELGDPLESAAALDRVLSR